MGKWANSRADVHRDFLLLTQFSGFLYLFDLSFTRAYANDEEYSAQSATESRRENDNPRRSGEA